MTKWRATEIYTFKKWDRRFLLDVGRCEAYAIEQIDKEVLDLFAEPEGIEQAVKQLNKRYSLCIISSTIEKWKKNGILIPASGETEEAPFQPFNEEYTLTLNITHACNLKCRYCYVAGKASNGSSPFMTDDTAKKAVNFMFDQFSTMQSLRIGFFGGEPLLNSSIIKGVMQYASEKAAQRGLPDIEYHFSTNGTLLTDDFIDFWRDYHVSFLVSLDGDEETHNRMRVFPDGKGSHEVITRNLKNLIGSVGKNNVGLSAVITHDGSMKSAYDYLSNLGVSKIKLGCVRYVQPNAFTFTKSDKIRYVKELEDVGADSLQRMLHGLKPLYSDFEEKILQLWKHVRRRYFCPAGIRRVAVAPTGDVYPCGPAAGLGQFKIGNVDSGLEQEKMRAFEMQLGIDGRGTKCRKCWARYLCAGGCLLDFVRLYDEDCRISMASTELAIAIYAIVKEVSQLLFISLTDQSFLSSLTEALATSGFGKAVAVEKSNSVVSG